MPDENSAAEPAPSNGGGSPRPTSDPADHDQQDGARTPFSAGGAKRAPRFDIPPPDRPVDGEKVAAVRPDGTNSYEDPKRQSESFAKQLREIAVESVSNGDRVSAFGWAAKEAGASSPSDWPTSAFEAAESDPYRIAFLIALAVQHGCPDNLVKSAAKKLEDRFISKLSANVELEKKSGPLKLNLPPPQARLLQIFQAETFRLERDAAPSERLRFVGGDYARAVIGYAWFDLGSAIGSELAPWIDELAHTPALESRLATGSAAGLLAQRDFPGIKAQFIDKWYRDASAKPLDSIDAALTVASTFEATRTSAVELVRRWSNADSINGYWATGALTRGLWGRKHPDMAMEGLAALLKHADSDAYDQAVRSFATWFERGAHDTAAGARAMIGLQQTADGKEIDWEVRLQRDLIFMSLIGAAAEDDGAGVRALRGAMSTDESRRATARMLHEVFSPVHLESVHLKLDMGAKAAMEDLVLSAAKRNVSDDPAWTLIDAGIRFATDKERDKFVRWLELRRETAVRRRAAGVSRFDGAVSGALSEQGAR